MNHIFTDLRLAASNKIAAANSFSYLFAIAFHYDVSVSTCKGYVTTHSLCVQITAKRQGCYVLSRLWCDRIKMVFLADLSLL